MSVKAGQRLRHQGQAQATHAADPRTLLHVDSVIAEAVASGQPFSANDLRDRLPVTSRGLVGARLDSVRKRGLIEAVGFEPSTLKSTRGHRILIWQSREAVAATLDLDDHESLAKWALRQPSVAACLAEDRWIHAIKELRTLTGSSLYQAKRAIDVARAAA